MAATGTEVVILRQLKSLYDALVAKINDVAGGTPATGSVTTDSIANGAVTAGKIAADAVTADKIATGAVTSDAIANGTITAADIATGVIPDVSEFITETEADAAYAAKSHTHDLASLSSPGFMPELTNNMDTFLRSDGTWASPPIKKAQINGYGGIKIGYYENGKNYPVELDDNGRAFVYVPWIDSIYTLPKATSTTLGGVKTATDEDAKAFLGY